MNREQAARLASRASVILDAAIVVTRYTADDFTVECPSDPRGLRAVRAWPGVWTRTRLKELADGAGLTDWRDLGTLVRRRGDAQ